MLEELDVDSAIVVSPDVSDAFRALLSTRYCSYISNPQAEDSLEIPTFEAAQFGVFRLKSIGLR